MLGFLLRRRAISRLSVTPPVARADRHGLALVLIVRNEERHIREWAAFHRAAGARHVYAFDNGCTDGTIPALRATLGDAVTVMPWRQGVQDALSGVEIHAQVLAYAHAICNFGGRYRWMAFIDADEFLIPRRADTLDAALAHLGDHRNLSLPWHMFGRNGHQTPPPEGMLRGYRRRARDPMGDARGLRNFKCIVDPCHVTQVGVHAFQTDGQDITVNDRGEVASNARRDRRGFYSADHLQLNHYYARSDAELAEKIGRGVFPAVRADGHARRVQTIVQNIEADEIEDRAALDYLDRQAAAQDRVGA